MEIEFFSVNFSLKSGLVVKLSLIEEVVNCSKFQVENLEVENISAVDGLRRDFTTVSPVLSVANFIFVLPNPTIESAPPLYDINVLPDGFNVYPLTPVKGEELLLIVFLVKLTNLLFLIAKSGFNGGCFL